MPIEAVERLAAAEWKRIIAGIAAERDGLMKRGDALAAAVEAAGTALPTPAHWRLIREAARAWRTRGA